MSIKELPPQYDSKAHEDEIYRLWEESGFFNPDNLPGRHKEPYTIIMPPPNVTGTLHMGHALMLVIQDILIRFRRMQGRKTLWLPGTDHAAIATQSKVEAMIYKEEEKTRFDLGRDEFLARVQKFAQESHDTIVRQVKKMGSSADWSREAYTLDDARSAAVNEAFRRMYDMGLVFRGKRIVNWDRKLETTVSDDEVDWKEEVVPLYYLKYGPFVIATARPETKFGDKYVVMHPDDKRYAKYKHGDTFELEWINGPVTATVIKDPVIDMAFGTGVMTITPWHDMTDFDIAKRHKLSFEQIIDFRGKLLPIAGDLAGVHIKKARPLIFEKLKAKGLLEKVEEGYAHRIATNSRGGGIIEPQIKEQWFIAVNKEFAVPHDGLKNIPKGTKITLKELMRRVVEEGEIKIIPDHFAKTYFNWINNLHDWCISRQIWYGHRIPVWYKNNEMRCSIESPSGDGWEQDPDTLDTWFSSGLWTFSTLGWPNDTKDFKTFHPTDVLETGYDILFFWVARMILMTGALVGNIPFRTVYMHGLVRDESKQKMSKSKGNAIDPLDITDKYGTDALRFALIFSTAMGNDISLAEDRIKGMKHFTNKLWNIARFVFSNTEESDYDHAITPKPQTDADTVILARLADIRKEVTSNLEAFRIHEAAQVIYQFVWHEFADIYIEASKEQLKDERITPDTRRILTYVLVEILTLLHPFIPFVTETLYQATPKKTGLLMVREWQS